MKKKICLLLFASTLAFTLLACGTESSDQTDEQQSVSEEADEQESALDESVEIVDEVSSDDIEIIAEYTLADSLGWYSRHFMIIKNNSDVTVDISTSSLAYSAEGDIVSAADGYCDALGAGCISIICEAFETGETVDHYEVTMNVKESEYYESVIQDLSYVQNDISEGAVFQVTNNGEEPAEFVEGYALFFLGDTLVDYNCTYFTDDDSQIQPGATISEQMTSYEEFDSVEFYLTGERSIY